MTKRSSNSALPMFGVNRIAVNGILKEMAELFGTILSFCWGKEDNNGHLETNRFEICPKNHQPQGWLTLCLTLPHIPGEFQANISSFLLQLNRGNPVNAARDPSTTCWGSQLILSHTSSRPTISPSDGGAAPNSPATTSLEIYRHRSGR